MKKKSGILFGLATGMAAAGVSIWCLGQSLYRRIFKTDEVAERQATGAAEREGMIFPAQPVTCQSRDQFTLGGYCRRQEQSHRWAICLHGYRSRPERMGHYGLAYAERGYSVLLPALRGHGASEGTYVGMGWHDRLDLLCWIRWILEQDPAAEIVLHGVSMGAATVLLAAGESLPQNVRAVVADCGYTTARAELRYVAAHQASPLLVPAVPLLSAVTRHRAKYRLGDAAPLEAVKKTNLPILFIHGEKDDFVPPEMARQLYEAASGPRELYLVQEAGHAESARIAPKQYWAAVDGFLKRRWEDRTIAENKQNKAMEE